MDQKESLRLRGIRAFEEENFNTGPEVYPIADSPLTYMNKHSKILGTYPDGTNVIVRLARSKKRRRRVNKITISSENACVSYTHHIDLEHDCLCDNGKSLMDLFSIDIDKNSKTDKAALQEIIDNVVRVVNNSISAIYAAGDSYLKTRDEAAARATIKEELEKIS